MSGSPACQAWRYNEPLQYVLPTLVNIPPSLSPSPSSTYSNPTWEFNSISAWGETITMMATSDPDIHLCYSPLVPLLISPHHAMSEQTVVPNWLKYFFSHQAEIFSPTATATMGQTLHYEATASNYYAAMYLKWVRLFTNSQFYCYWQYYNFNELYDIWMLYILMWGNVQRYSIFLPLHMMYLPWCSIIHYYHLIVSNIPWPPLASHHHWDGVLIQLHLLCDW